MVGERASRRFWDTSRVVPSLVWIVTAILWFVLPSPWRWVALGLGLGALGAFTWAEWANHAVRRRMMSGASALVWGAATYAIVATGANALWTFALTAAAAAIWALLVRLMR